MATGNSRLPWQTRSRLLAGDILMLACGSVAMDGLRSGPHEVCGTILLVCGAVTLVCDLLGLLLDLGAPKEGIHE